jgi:hypothetical protein
LTATAVRDGDEWVVNGQKLWSTSAHHADYGMLLARTDWDVPKHLGISWMVLPMHQAGVEARPLKQMNGHASFNEVFLTDARVPVANVVGRPGDGWTVARTTLAHERGFASLRRPRFAEGRSRALREAEEEARSHFETYRWYPQRAGPRGSRRRTRSRYGTLDRSRRAPADRRTPVVAARPTSGPRSEHRTTAPPVGRLGPRVRSASSG